MTMLEKKIDALLRAVTAEDEEARKNAVAEAKALCQSKDAARKDFALKDCAEDILLEIGIQPSLVGFNQLVEALVLCCEDDSYLRDITSRLYPDVAKKLNTTAFKAERGIRHAIENLFQRSDIELLEQYFGNSVDIRKGRPTNSEFIARMRIEVMRRMR